MTDNHLAWRTNERWLPEKKRPTRTDDEHRLALQHFSYCHWRRWPGFNFPVLGAMKSAQAFYVVSQDGWQRFLEDGDRIFLRSFNTNVDR